MQEKISWVADEFKKQYYDRGWYAGLFLVGALLVAWALYTRNIIAVILFVLIVAVIYISSQRHPEKVLVELNDRGVSINGILYPYRGLKYFWIFHEPPYISELHIETNRLLNKKLVIQLEEQNPEKTRQFLGDHLEELEDYEENFIDYLIRRLRL